MILYEISPAYYVHVMPLYAHLWRDQALADGVFEGRYTAKIFVDDLLHPTSSLMAYNGGEYFVVGDPQCTSLLQFLTDTPAESGIFDRSHFAYFVPNVAWETPLKACGIHQLHPSRCFHHATNPFPPLSEFQARTRADAQLRRVDDQFFADVQQGVIHDLGHDFLGRPNQVSHFEWMRANGHFAFLAIVNGEVASIAYANSVSEHYAMLFIDTEERYWRQGLGRLACAGFIHHCLALGKTALWGCLTANTKSASMALSLGFQEEQPCLESDWKPYGDDFLPMPHRWQVTPEADYRVWTKRT